MSEHFETLTDNEIDNAVGSISAQGPAQISGEGSDSLPSGSPNTAPGFTFRPHTHLPGVDGRCMTCGYRDPDYREYDDDDAELEKALEKESPALPGDWIRSDHVCV